MKIYKIITLLFILLFITSCSNKKLNNRELTLSGDIITRELYQDGDSYEVSVLNLNNPLTIDGTTVNAIELNYNERLSSEDNITIVGRIEENNTSKLGLGYILEVSSIIK